MAGPAVGSASCPSELRVESTHSFRDRLRALFLLGPFLLAPIKDVLLRAGTVARLSLCVSWDGAPPGIRRGQEVFPEAGLQAYGFELSNEGALRYHQGSVDRCIAKSHRRVSVNKYLVHFYGVYATRVRSTCRTRNTPPPAQTGDPTPPRRVLPRRWAQLIYRIYQVDPLTCRCGAKMRIVAFITEPSVILPWGALRSCPA